MPTDGHTLAEAAAEYIVDLERRGKSSERQLYALKPVVEALGALPLDHVHQRTIQGWIDAQRGQRASGTVIRSIQAVSTVLHFAAEVLRDGNRPWLTTAPPRLRTPDWGAREPHPLALDEQRRLVAALPPHLTAPVMFALTTGARQEEIVSLRWEQAQTGAFPEYAVWWVPPEVRKASAKKTVSQQTGRYLIANADARVVLQGQVGKDATWVFPSPQGGRLYRINNHGWRTACRTAGVTLRVHDLRHTFGRRAADAGIPLDIRRSLLGHEHRDITLHYSAPGLARLLEEAEKMVGAAGIEPAT